MAQDNFSLLNANLDDSLRPLFANKYFLASIALFFALYAGWLAPKLPNSVIYFFDTIPGKLLFIFIIAFVASRRVENSFQVALVVSVMFLVTLTVLNKVKMQEAFQNLSMEHFNLMGTMQNIMQGQQQEDLSGAQVADGGLPTPKGGLDQECNDGKCNDEKHKCDESSKKCVLKEVPSQPAPNQQSDPAPGQPAREQQSNPAPSQQQSNPAPSQPQGGEHFEAFSNYNNYSDY
jgi:hypothetical protein